jgi:hypothetical protein
MEPSGGKKWKKHENDGEKGDLWDEILGHWVRVE